MEAALPTRAVDEKPFFTTCETCGTLFITDGASAACATHTQPVMRIGTAPRSFVRWYRASPRAEAEAWAREARAIDGRAVCLVAPPLSSRAPRDHWLVFAAPTHPSADDVTSPRTRRF